MCIIIVKPKGVSLPTLATLENCWSHNDDGAGFMYARNGKVHGVKGFASAESLYSAALAVSTRRAMVLHFRFATHGPRTGIATHPFPISTDAEALTSLEWSAKYGVAHNGIIPKFGTKDLSDTMEFIQSVLAKPDISAQLHRKDFRTYLADATSSKYAFMDGSGKCYLAGKFIQAHGCHYSNDGYSYKWEPSKWAGVCGAGYGAWGDWEWNATRRGWDRPKDAVAKPAAPDAHNFQRSWDDSRWDAEWDNHKRGWCDLDPIARAANDAERAVILHEWQHAGGDDSWDEDCLYPPDVADTFCMYDRGWQRECLSCEMLVCAGESAFDMCMLSPEWRAIEAKNQAKGWPGVVV